MDEGDMHDGGDDEDLVAAVRDGAADVRELERLIEEDGDDTSETDATTEAEIRIRRARIRASAERVRRILRHLSADEAARRVAAAAPPGAAGDAYHALAHAVRRYGADDGDVTRSGP